LESSFFRSAHLFNASDQPINYNLLLSSFSRQGGLLFYSPKAIFGFNTYLTIPKIALKEIYILPIFLVISIAITKIKCQLNLVCNLILDWILLFLTLKCFGSNSSIYIYPICL